jgi:hypothetical protein
MFCKTLSELRNQKTHQVHLDGTADHCFIGPFRARTVRAVGFVTIPASPTKRSRKNVPPKTMQVYVSRINALGMDGSVQNANICIYWIKFRCKLTATWLKICVPSMSYSPECSQWRMAGDGRFRPVVEKYLLLK